MTTVVVAGALANKHRHGGSAWVRMSWVDALRSLGVDAGDLDGHDLHFTVGSNVGGPGWQLPSRGVRWRAIRQPVVLERWNVEPDAGFTGFTTVASWRGAYGPAVWNGRSYGVKAHQ